MFCCWLLPCVDDKALRGSETIIWSTLSTLSVIPFRAFNVARKELLYTESTEKQSEQGHNTLTSEETYIGQCKSKSWHTGGYWAKQRANHQSPSAFTSKQSTVLAYWDKRGYRTKTEKFVYEAACCSMKCDTYVVKLRERVSYVTLKYPRYSHSSIDNENDLYHIPWAYIACSFIVLHTSLLIIVSDLD